MKIATTVVKKNQQILLIKKPTNRYSMPGGKLENFEVPIKTAAREAFEETGLKLNTLKLKVISSITKDDKKFDMYTFYCEDFEGSIISDCKEGALEWVNIANISTIDMYPGDLEIIKHCLDSYDIVNKEFMY